MIVALEGHSYSGKTTLLNYLKDNLPIHPIAEHDAYAGGIDKYPPFPAVKKQMAKDSIDFFARLEVQRYKDAQEVVRQTVLYDRSFMSVVLFQKYMKHLSLPGEHDAYDYAKKLFADLLGKNQIALPDYFVYIQCDSLATYFQRQSREISVDSLRGEKALKFFEHAYEPIFNLYNQFGRALEIKSDDTEASLAGNARLLDGALDGISELDGTTREVITKRLMEVL